MNFNLLLLKFKLFLSARLTACVNDFGNDLFVVTVVIIMWWSCLLRFRLPSWLVSCAQLYIIVAFFREVINTVCAIQKSTSR